MLHFPLMDSIAIRILPPPLPPLSHRLAKRAASIPPGASSLSSTRIAAGRLSQPKVALGLCLSTPGQSLRELDLLQGQQCDQPSHHTKCTLWSPQPSQSSPSPREGDSLSPVPRLSDPGLLGSHYLRCLQSTHPIPILSWLHWIPSNDRRPPLVHVLEPLVPYSTS